MVKEAIVYLAFHEPLRVRLPAPQIPKGAHIEQLRSLLFDDEAADYYFRRWLEEVCRPYTDLLTQAVGSGLTLLISLAGPLLKGLASSNHSSARSFRELLAHPNVSVVATDPVNSLAIYLEAGALERQIRRCGNWLEEGLGVRPVAAAAPYLALSHEVYFVLGKLGFPVVLADGSPALLGGRHPGHLRRNGEGPFVCTRASELSMQLAAPFSWEESTPYDLQAQQAAQRVARTEGEFVMLGWRIPPPNGWANVVRQLAFLHRLFEELLGSGLEFVPAYELLQRHGQRVSTLPLPAAPVVAAEFGDISYFLGHPEQQKVFLLMRQAYAAATLTRSRELMDLSVELAQWDILELLHRLLVSGSSHSVEPGYLPPLAWPRLGPGGVTAEIRRVYEGFIDAVTSAYL